MFPPSFPHSFLLISQLEWKIWKAFSPSVRCRTAARLSPTMSYETIAVARYQGPQYGRLCLSTITGDMGYKFMSRIP